MAGLNVHIANIQFTAVNAATGVVVNKTDPATTISDVLKTQHDHRIIPDTAGTFADITNTQDSPTISTYLVRELPYSLVSLTQGLVITSDSESAMDVHVAYLQLLLVDQVGNVIDKNNPSTTIKRVLSSSTQHRVIVDDSIASSAGNPDIYTYIKAEAAAGYAVRHIDQTMIITYQF